MMTRNVICEVAATVCGFHFEWMGALRPNVANEKDKLLLSASHNANEKKKRKLHEQQAYSEFFYQTNVFDTAATLGGWKFANFC